MTGQLPTDEHHPSASVLNEAIANRGLFLIQCAQMVKNDVRVSFPAFIQQHAVAILENVDETPVGDLIKMLVDTDASLFASLLNSCVQRCGPSFAENHTMVVIKLFKLISTLELASEDVLWT